MTKMVNFTLYVFYLTWFLRFFLIPICSGDIKTYIEGHQTVPREWVLGFRDSEDFNADCLSNSPATLLWGQKGIMRKLKWFDWLKNRYSYFLILIKKYNILCSNNTLNSKSIFHFQITQGKGPDQLLVPKALGPELSEPVLCTVYCTWIFKDRSRL